MSMEAVLLEIALQKGEKNGRNHVSRSEQVSRSLLVHARSHAVIPGQHPNLAALPVESAYVEERSCGWSTCQQL